MKKTAAALIAFALCAALLAGCGGINADTISVISREDGSGTRGAFVELFGIEIINADGEKEDMTTLDADVTDSTSVMLTSVANNSNAIGYVSLGTLGDAVKALDVDGSAATAENIKSGDYKAARSFNIAVRAEVSPAARNYIDYIMSAEGQAVIEANGYIGAAQGEPYDGAAVAGKVVVAGSSSVTPVMEKLKEAYLALNPNAEVEIQQSDSTTGMTNAADGTCDIGMASRELKESEVAAGLTAFAIALDGIAVIVNRANPLDSLTSEQIRRIFTGEVASWTELEE